MGEENCEKVLRTTSNSGLTPNPEHVEYFSKQEECDFFFVTHDGPNKDALKYCPNTTWTDTRNVLAFRNGSKKV
jgi:hypothetical protein